MLCRDSEDGAQKVWQNGAIIGELLKIITDTANWSDELALFAIRVVDELAKKRERVQF